MLPNQVAIYMEQENIRIGEARGFRGIFTTNANRLTQLISRSLGYQILSTIQVLTQLDSIAVSLFTNRETAMKSILKPFFPLSFVIQVNQYEDIHGGRPFASAPDDLVTEVALKRF